MKFFKIILLLWASVSFAKPTYIEISASESQGLPIAVLDFESTDDSFVNIADIIKTDLQSSGQFYNVVYEDLDELLKDDTPDITKFREVGLENVVTGKIEKVGLHSYNITFELLDIYKRPSGPAKVVTPTLSKKFSQVHPQNFRALAHHISDEIFYKLLGVKGIFSTKISYITKDFKQNRHSLHIADFDGFNAKKVYTSNYPIMSPSWSNDGEKIAFVAFENHQSVIKILNIVTGDISQIKHFPGVNSSPKWSPKDDKLALVLSKDGSLTLYVYDLEGKTFSRLTRGNNLDTEPTWAPDGQSIFFTSNRGGLAQIYQINLNDKKIKRLTFDGNYNSTPNITYDNQFLVMMHLNEDGNFNIARQSLKTGELKIITDSVMDDSPSIAPNGTMIIYSSKSGKSKKLKAVSLDGKFHIDLPQSYEGTFIQQPAWSPFLKN